MGIFRKYALAAVAAMGLSAGSANAAVILNSNGQSFNFNWSFYSVAGHLAGYGTMTVGGLGTSNLTLAIKITNQQLDRLVSFGFGTDPNVSGVSLSDGSSSDTDALTTADFDVSPPINLLGGFAAIEVCAYSGENCNGGGSGGLLSGQFDEFILTLTKAGGGNWADVTVGPLAIRYQAAIDSFKFNTGCESTQVGACGEINLPEPSSLPMVLMTLLSLLGFGYLGMSRRARA